MRRVLTPLLALLLVTGGLVGADLLLALGGDDTPVINDAGPIVAGGWYCGAVGSVGADVTQFVAAAPRAEVEPPSQVRYAELLGGSRTNRVTANVFPESVFGTELTPDVDQGAVELRWDAFPIVASRIWRTRPETGPRGVVAGACATGPDETWWIPGLSTAGGAQATLYVVNPFAEAASIQVTFLTPEGELDPVRLRNQVVPPNGTLQLQVADFLPRQGDLAVEVVARSGRVLVEAVQRVDAAIGGINGVSLVRAAEEPRPTWTIPWALVGDVEAPPVPPAPTPTDTDAAASDAPTDGATTTAPPADTATATDEPADGTTATDEPSDVAPPTDQSLPIVDGGPLAGSADVPATSWVWIANPGDEPVPVMLTLHAERGPVVPELGEELSVPARGVRRIPLDGLLPEGTSTAGVTVTAVDDAPILVSLGTVARLSAADDDRTGYSVQRGENLPDVSWVLSGPGDVDGILALHLVNPSAEPAVVDVVLWDGAVGQRPPSLQGLTVRPGGFLEVALDPALLQSSTYTIFVTAREGSVVAGSRSVRATVPIDWSVTTGVPASVWRGGGGVPVIRERPGLVEELD